MFCYAKSGCLRRVRCFVTTKISQNLFSSHSHGSSVDLTDLRFPHSWYPLARKKKRHVVLHVGPTNSGKTYHALKRLEASFTGIYCGPLRLLAWEVAERLNKANVKCSLITGQEREEIDGAEHKAVTVEMAEVTREFKCAVVDEIQMLGCPRRGYSFTRAILGLAVDELHLCGDPAVVPLIQDILQVTGDEIEVKHYDRLSPLIASYNPLRSFTHIRRGDCVVAFSRRDIYDIKREVELESKYLCSVVYGSLPPETRTRQAKMFNDEQSEFDVLVASDAVGMGLNLNIGRIIFSTLQKFDGEKVRELTAPEIKQIAGRAGRYGSRFPRGKVTCLSKDDLPLLHSALQTPSPFLKAAGLFPTYDILSLYSRIHPDYSFYSILEHFVENAKLSPNYFLSNCETMMKVAAQLEKLPLNLEERYLFCISPTDMDDDISFQGLIQFAKEYAKTGVVHLKKLFTPKSISLPETPNQMTELESIHKVLELYAWLSYRVENGFPDRVVATTQKAVCGMLIEEYLERYGSRKAYTKRMKLGIKRR